MAYTNNIPQATDRPNNSQPLILANFAAIATLNAVNHVAFDAADQGKHKFVTMPIQGAAPGAAANEITLYSRTSVLSGRAELAFERSTGVVTEFTSALAAAQGWTRLPSGILLKWMFAQITADTGITTQLWPTGATVPAFTSVFSVFITPISTNNRDRAVTLSQFDALGFTLYGTKRSDTTVIASNYNAFAIGI